MGGRRNSKSSRIAYTFESAADFEEFTNTHDVAVVSKDGLLKRGVRSLRLLRLATISY